MRMRLAWTLTFLFLAAAVAPVQGSDKAEMVRANLGTKFSGTFQWDAGGEVQKLEVTIERVRLSAEKTVVATGRGRYDSAGQIIDIKVMWQIDPNSLRFEMWEASPSSDSFVSDGSHVGSISNDLKSITARWTTQGSGDQGTLELTDLAAARGDKKSEK